jgi:hypothetical protein
MKEGEAICLTCIPFTLIYCDIELAGTIEHTRLPIDATLALHYYTDEIRLNPFLVARLFIAESKENLPCEAKSRLFLTGAAYPSCTEIV